MPKMSRAQAISQALKKPVIPFVPVIPHDQYKTVSLEFVRNIGTAARPNNIKKKVQAYFCSNQDIEYILRTIMEFDDIADNRMNLAGGQERFDNFRDCLGGTTRNTWDAVATNQPRTNQGFALAKCHFIDYFVLQTDLAERISKVNAELSTKKAAVEDVDTELSTKNAELLKQKAVVKAVSVDLSTKQAKLSKKKAAIEDVDIKLSTKNAELSKKKAAVEAVSGDLSAINTELSEKKASVANYKRMLQKPKQQLNKSQSKDGNDALVAVGTAIVSNGSNQLAEEKAELDAIKRERQSLLGKIQRLEDCSEGAGAELSKKQVAINAAVRELQGLEDEKQATLTRSELLEKQISQRQNKLRCLEANVSTQQQVSRRHPGCWWLDEKEQAAKSNISGCSRGY